MSDQEKVIAGEADLDYHMHARRSCPSSNRPTSPASRSSAWSPSRREDEINEALGKLAANNKSYETKEGEAEKDDAVVIDFVGSIDGEEFEGGSAEGTTLVIGSGRFIPGFEDQLIGAKAGDDMNVNVTFPDDYPVDTLKGKPAVFEVKVKEVKAPKDAEIDEEFAKTLGLENLDALKGALKAQLSGELSFATRQQVKRVLLDALDEKHSFDLPPMMVKAEFDQIWAPVRAGKERRPPVGRGQGQVGRGTQGRVPARSPSAACALAWCWPRSAAAPTSQITNEELGAGPPPGSPRYPGQEKQVIEFYRNNPGALAQLRAPIYEEKVVDYILSKATVTDKPVTREELMKEVGDE